MNILSVLGTFTHFGHGQGSRSEMVMEAADIKVAL